MRIAIVGTSPSSRHLAPYGDKSWTIWGTGPGNLQPESPLPRCDVFFELHPFDELTSDHTWMPFLNQLRKVPKVYLQKPEPEVLPQSVEYPMPEMVEKYGPYFFTSSFSWMCSMAIRDLLASSDEEKVVGFWGVDCSATEEYANQRPGAHFFFMKMREAGIKVVCPPESDLLLPPGLYGYDLADPWKRKQLARQREYLQAHAIARSNADSENQKATRLLGSLDDIQWNLNTWANRHHLYQTTPSLPVKEPPNGTEHDQPGE